MTLTIQSQHKSFAGLQSVYRHPAETTGCEMEFSLYLPQISQTQPRPVIFYLSGLTCTQENVTTKGGFQQFADRYGIIVVCPDTSPRGFNFPGEHDSYDFGSGAGFYLNATQAPWSQNYRMYDYITEELTSLLVKNFPVIPDAFAITGHSMGGHGALTIGLKNPQLFKSISAFAPIVAPSQCPWGQKAFQGYLGDDRSAWAAYDATELVNAGHRSANNILIDQGTNDDFLEEQLKPELFLKACRDKLQPVEMRMQVGYDHSYYFMNTFMQDHFEFHATNLGLI